MTFLRCVERYGDRFENARHAMGMFQRMFTNEVHFMAHQRTRRGVSECDLAVPGTDAASLDQSYPVRDDVPQAMRELLADDPIMKQLVEAYIADPEGVRPKGRPAARNRQLRFHLRFAPGIIDDGFDIIEYLRGVYISAAGSNHQAC